MGSVLTAEPEKLPGGKDRKDIPGDKRKKGKDQADHPRGGRDHHQYAGDKADNSRKLREYIAFKHNTNLRQSNRHKERNIVE